MALLGPLLALLLSGPAHAIEAQDGHACLRAADLVCAEKVRDALVKSDPDDIETITLNARTLFYEGRFAEADAQLQALARRGRELDQADAPIEATAAATAGFKSRAGKGVVVRYAPGLDEVLVDEALATMIKARAVLDPILGGGPNHDIVLDIFPDGRSFIAASGLPAEAVRTTGVVALSKWTRLLVTSPRALARGYAWKDTIAHEYIHLVVAYRTGDKAPVWLQEGLAKHLEGFWRGETTGHLSAQQQSLLAGAIHADRFVPFEKFRYSMAYLDSGEEAALAFAQVATMVGFLIDKSGQGALASVLDDVRDGKDPSKAVAKAAKYEDFDRFREGWLGWIATLPLVVAQLASLPVVLDGEGGDFADDPLLAARSDLARFARLGDLLREAGRPSAALIEYKKAEDSTGPASPLLLAREAACYKALGDTAKALELARRGVELYPEFALLQVTLGGLLEATGQPAEARAAWLVAHDLNPFDPDVQQAIVRLSEALSDPATADRHRRYLRLLSSGGVAGVGSSPGDE